MCDGLRRNKIVRVGKNSGPVLSRLWTKVQKICAQCRRFFVLSNALAWLSISNFFQQIFALSLEVVLNRTNVKVFWPQFFWKGRPRLLYGGLLARFTAHRLAKFGWVPFADLRLRSLAMKWNAEFTEGGWKLTSNLKPFVDQSLCCFEAMRRSLVFATHLPAYVYRVSFQRYRESKKVVLDPRFAGGGDTLDFGHVFSNCTYFRPCGRICLSTVQQAQRLERTKKLCRQLCRAA